MVMFHSEIPYKVAQERGEIQQQLLEQLTKNINTLSEIDFDHAIKIVRSKLTPLQ
jgi:kynurenine 3-monooxygenase